jgi:hypothetical protein
MDPPTRIKPVRNTTESKYVVVSPIPDGDAGCAAARPRRPTDEK